MNITPDQVRAARALLRLEQEEVSRRAHVSVVTIRRIEAAHDAGRVAPATLAAVRTVLESAGAEFIPGGVRRRGAGPTEKAALFETLRTLSLRSADRLRGHALLTDHDLYDGDGLPA